MGTEVWHSTQLTIASLFFNAVFTLLVFVLINLLLQRFIPRLAMSQADLQTIYVMGRDGINDQRTYHDGIPHPGPRAYISVRNPRKTSGYRSLETVSPVGSPSKVHVSWTDSITATLRSTTSATLNVWIPPVLAWSSFVNRALADVISRNGLST